MTVGFLIFEDKISTMTRSCYKYSTLKTELSQHTKSDANTDLQVRGCNSGLLGAWDSPVDDHASKRYGNFRAGQ